MDLDVIYSWPHPAPSLAPEIRTPLGVCNQEHNIGETPGKFKPKNSKKLHRHNGGLPAGELMLL